jgi:hypothetical protein
MIYSYAKIYMASCRSLLDTTSRGHAIWPLGAVVKVEFPPICRWDWSTFRSKWSVIPCRAVCKTHFNVKSLYFAQNSDSYDSQNKKMFTSLKNINCLVLEM